MNNSGNLGSAVRCSLQKKIKIQQCVSANELWKLCFHAAFLCTTFKMLQKPACVYVCYYADHECSSRRVQLSRLDTVNVGRSPGCWIMDQRRTPAQPNAVWSDVTVISADWCRPQRADSPLYRLVNHTHTHTLRHSHARDRKRSSANAHETIRAFLIKCRPSHVTNQPVW